MAFSAREDFGRVALGAPALKEVFIVSIPDCLLIKSWARAERTNEEETAVQLGTVFRASITALATAVGSESIEGVTVEAKSALIRLEYVTAGMMAAFVFERTAPLGLMRVQARQLRDHIKGSVEQFTQPTDTGAARAVTSSIDRAAPRFSDPPSTEERAPPRFGPRGPDELSATPALGIPRMKRPAPTAPALDRARAADAFTREVTPFVAEATQAPDPTPLPNDLTIRPPERDAQPPSNEAEITGRFERPEIEPPKRPPIPEVPTRPVARPRAVRLLDFFRRYAPDPHAALLRLSLRTGIPVDLLEAPDALDDAQVDAIADSIRDILGQETVGI